MARYIILTPCTQNKTTTFPPSQPPVMPSHYLPAARAAALAAARAASLGMPGGAFKEAGPQVHAVDLYVRHPDTQLYRNLREAKIAHLLASAVQSERNEVEWYFLSAGYGILHALELAAPYQASWTYNIARKAGIPYTKRIWRPVLPGLLDDILTAQQPFKIYVFGPKDYAEMVKATKFFAASPSVFEFNIGRATDSTARARLRDLVRLHYGL